MNKKLNMIFSVIARLHFLQTRQSIVYKLLIPVFLFTSTVSFASIDGLLSDPFSLALYGSQFLQNSEDIERYLRDEYGDKFYPDRETEEQRRWKKTKRMVQEKERGGQWLDGHEELNAGDTTERRDNGVHKYNDNTPESTESDSLEKITGDDQTSLQGQFEIPTGMFIEYQGGPTANATTIEGLAKIVASRQIYRSVLVDRNEMTGEIDRISPLIIKLLGKTRELEVLQQIYTFFTDEDLSIPAPFVQRLILRWNGVDFSQIEALCRFLVQLRSLRELTLSGVAFNNRAEMEEFLQILPQLPHLRQIDFTNCFMGPGTSPALVAALRLYPRLNVRFSRDSRYLSSNGKLQNILQSRSFRDEFYKLLSEYTGKKREQKDDSGNYMERAIGDLLESYNTFL